MRKLTIKRTINASIEKVWEAFTTPEKLSTWWSPEGMSSSYLSVDFREGGLFRFCFNGSDGNKFWGRGIYQKLTKPTFISYLDSFSDAQGNPVPPSHYGIPGNEIIESLIEINLSEAGERTDMAISMDNGFDESMTENMTKGWNGMFDKLAKIFDKG